MKPIERSSADSRPAIERGRSGADAVVAGALDAIVVIDASGAIIEYNPAAERMFGWPREQVLGREVAETIIPPELRQRHRDGMARHLLTGTSAILERPVELVALRADGSRFPVELSIIRLDVGASPTFTAFIRDITGPRRLLDDLRRHTTRLTAILHASHELDAAYLAPEILPELAAGAVQRAFSADGASLERIDGDALVHEAGVGVCAARIGLRRPLAGTPECTALQSRRAIVAAEDAPGGEHELRSRVIAPIVLRERTVGFVTVGASVAQAFDQDDAKALELLAASIGVAWQRRADDDERQQRAAVLGRIVALQQQIAAADDPLDVLLQRVTAQVGELVGADAALLLCCDGEERLRVAAAAGDDTAAVGTLLPRRGTLADACLQAGTVLRATAGQADAADPAVERSTLSAPLRGHAQALGSLQVTARRADAFSEYDLHHLQILAAALAAAIQRDRTKRRLQRSEHEYRMLFDHNPHPMWVYDEATLGFLAVNHAAVQQYGFSREDFLRMTVSDIRPPGETRAPAVTPATETYRALHRHLRRSGETIDVEITADAIEFEGRAARLVMAHDVTLRLRAEEGQASANRALRILSACNGAMIRIGDETRLLNEICRIVVEIGGYRMAGVGYAQDDAERSLLPVAAAGIHAENIVQMRLSWSADSPWGQGPAGRTVRSGRLDVEPDLANAQRPFRWREAALSMGFRSAITLPLNDEARCFGFLGLYSDKVADPQDGEIALLQELAENISFGVGALRAERERLAVERKLAHLATHDATTGLLRYKVLEPQLAAMLANPARLTAVMIVDLDRFKAVNESLGHLVGDRVLRHLATRIGSFAGSELLVAHFAADQFFLAMSARDAPSAIALAERLREAVGEPLDEVGFRLVMSATIGLSHAPQHGQAPLELIRAAQAAMERGKAQGRDTVCVFQPEQLREIEDRVLLGSRLRLAVERNELCLHFQPQFAAAGRRLTGFEALLRWTNPELGNISPARFIPLAEALGLMPEIGDWVIHDACRQARAWLDVGREAVVIAVNVSAQQLQRAGLVECVDRALAEYALPPHVLDIELTESSLMENVSRVQGTLAELKQRGVRLSLDDFGTGYSSLSYLKNFSLDKLKIDQSFVRGLPENQDDAAIARMIVAIGHQLRLSVAAEGVETAAQADFLRDIGCDELQGYHLGRPALPAAAEAHFPRPESPPP